MALYTVSYQLNDKKDYPKLWAEFERLEGQKVMRSVYFIDIEEDDTSEVRAHFVSFIDEDDYICVIPMKSRPYKYKCRKGTKKWIDDRF